MPQRHGERAAIEILHRVEAALRRPVEPAVGMVRRIGQKARAHHRRRGERNEEGDRHRHRKSDRELPEQAADDRAHQKDGQENRDERNADRNDGESDLARAKKRSLHPRLAELHVAGNVLEHDNGVVDDEAGRNRQRHERQIVEAKSQQIHRAERADDRHWNRDAGNRGGAQIAQKDEDDERDKHNRQDERLLGIGQRGADRLGTVERDLEIDIAGQRGGHAGQFRLHRIDRFDDIRARLAIENDQHRRLAVRQPGIAQIFDRIRRPRRRRSI